MRAAADRWLAAFQRLEGEAIARGEDVRSEHALRDLLAAADTEVPRPDVPWSFTWKQWGVAAGVLLLVVAWMIDRLRRSRRHLPGGG